MKYAILSLLAMGMLASCGTSTSVDRSVTIKGPFSTTVTRHESPPKGCVSAVPNKPDWPTLPTDPRRAADFAKTLEEQRDALAREKAECAAWAKRNK